MTSAISCPLWSSVYECQRVECAFTCLVRIECGMFVMYCIQLFCSAWIFYHHAYTRITSVAGHDHVY